MTRFMTQANKQSQDGSNASINSLWNIKLSYLVIFAVPVHHPVLPVGADFQFEGCDVVGLLRLLGNGALCGDAC